MFDEKKARRVIRFIECLKHTKGEFHGKPFKLLPWQEKIIRDVFGTVRDKDPSMRQYNQVYIEIGKKNGKSELGAALALNMLINDDEWKAEVYSCASDRQQAAIVFDVAVDMVRQSPALMKRIKIIPSMKRMVYQPTGSIYQVLSSEVADLFDIDEQVYLSILPTATQYARNAIFSGLMPQQIAEMFPELWVDEDEEEGKNLNEKPLIQTQIDRSRRHDKFSYHKINDSADSDKYLSQFNNLYQNDFNVLVINFIDILSHARTEMKMIRELANNESAYRSITRSWFRHSVLTDLLRLLSQSDYKVIITTDHGSIRTTKPVKIVGDRNTNTNLRYKLGKNLSYHGKDLFVIKNPHQAQLPAPNLSTAYVFATGDAFFAYPNNYNYYVSYYKDTFQHGGISMEEMIVPLITLTPRKR